MEFQQETLRLTTQQHLMKQTFQLIDNCQKAIKNGNGEKRQNTQQLRKTKFTFHETNKEQEVIQEKQQAQKQFKRLKIKAKKSQKYPSIKKTDLGDNQIVFTQADMKKLELIDEFIEKGLEIPDLNLLQAKTHQTPWHQELVASIQPNYNEQINNFRDWGENGNKTETLQSINPKNGFLFLKSFPRKHEQTTSIKRQMKCTKTINFQKHFPKLQSRSQFEKENSQMNQSYRLRNSNTSLFNRLNPSYMTKSKDKSKNRFQKKKHIKTLGSQLSNNKRIRGKLDQLTKETSVKYSNFLASTYMTSERNQGLYQCQLLRKAKHALNRKQYMNLHITYTLGSENEALSPDNHQSFDSMMKEKDKIQEGKTEIQEIIAMNRKRLRMEKQRVISKLKY